MAKIHIYQKWKYRRQGIHNKTSTVTRIKSKIKEKRKQATVRVMHDGRIKGNMVSSFPNDGNWKYKALKYCRQTQTTRKTTLFTNIQKHAEKQVTAQTFSSLSEHLNRDTLLRQLLRGKMCFQVKKQKKSNSHSYSDGMTATPSGSSTNPQAIPAHLYATRYAVMRV